MSIELPALPGLGAPTQPQYMSPDAIKAQRDYAKALMMGTVDKGTGPNFPVTQSWTQGVSNMVNALMGGLASRNADERDSAKIANATTPGGNGPTQPQAPFLGGTSFKEGSSSEGREKTADAGDLSPEAKAIASVESKGSGDYAALGPQTRTGDRAYGKYQVMGNNIPVWTKEVLGKSMTPAEFLANPSAQDAVFQTKFAQGGDNNNDRASVWFTGKPYAQGKGKSDGYINGEEYVKRFNANLPQGGGAGAPQTAMAFAGPDGGGAPPAVQAMTAALRGDNPQVAQNDQVAAAKGGPVGGFAPGQKPLPDPQRTGIYYDPRLIKVPPQYSQEQIRNIMALPESVMSPADKSAAFQQFRQQGQPMAMPYPGGSVLVDPKNPTVQQFIPEGHWSKSSSKLGDMEHSGDTFLVPGADGAIHQPPVIAPSAVGPRSDAAPPAGPVAPASAPVGPGGGPAVAPAVQGPVVAQTAPQAHATAPVVPPQGGAPVPPAVAAAAAGKPVQVASLDPAAGVAQAAGAVPPAPAAEAANPLAKWAAATPPGGAPVSAAGSPGSPGQNSGGLQLNTFSPQEVEDYQRQQEYKKNLAVDEDAQKKGTELAFKKYDALSGQAQNARTLQPNVDLALGLMNDPNFHSGLLSGAQDVWSRFKAAALGDKYANAPNETFDKLMASNVLGTMKTALGGLGQVRLAEIQLLTKANGSRNNTDASNRAVLEISRRGLQKVDQIDGMGQEYVSGGSVNDPITGKELIPANLDRNGEVQPRRGLDVGFDKIVRKWTNENPSFTPDEIKNYNTIFDTARPPGESAPPAKTNEKAAASPADSFPPAPQEAIDILRKNPGSRELFEKRFGPADQYLKK